MTANEYMKKIKDNLDSVEQNLEQIQCDDCISRQVVKEQMIKYGFHAPDMTVTEFVEDLPPVNPQEPKTGFIPKSVIEDIKSEIRSIQSKWHENAGKHNCIDEVIKIIDKHIGGKEKE